MCIRDRDKVYSIIKADNEASKRVALGIGMRKEDEFIARYYNCLLYTSQRLLEKSPLQPLYPISHDLPLNSILQNLISGCSRIAARYYTEWARG